GAPADNRDDLAAVSAGPDSNVADESDARSSGRCAAGCRQADALLQHGRPRIGGRRQAVPVQAAVCACEGESVVEHDAADRVVEELVPADSDECAAARSLVEDADAGIRVGARVLLARTDPEGV